MKVEDMATQEKRVPIGEVGTRVRKNIRHLRDQQNLTYAELARRINGHLTEQALRRIENEARRVDVDDLAAISDALGVEPSQLMAKREAEPLNQMKIKPELRDLLKLAFDAGMTYENNCYWGDHSTGTFEEWLRTQGVEPDED